MRNVASALEQHNREAPDQVAITLLHSGKPDQALTYQKLYRAAEAYASRLQCAGVRPEDVVVLILEHGQDLVASFFGAVLLGAVPAIMPFLSEKLSPEHYRQSLQALFAITRPAAVVCAAEFATDVRAASADYPGVHLMLAGNQESGEHQLETQRLPGLDANTEATVLLQHSSGTTGLQKGVALSHRAVFNQLDAYAHALHLSPQDVVVSWLPLYHDMGLIAGFLLPVLTRTPLVLLSPFDWVRAPYRLLQAVTRYRGTLTWLPNFAYNFCASKIRERDLEGVDLSSWRAVINCSEPMYWQSHQAFLERFQPYGLQPGALATCYAMAENVFAVTQGGIDAPVTVDLVDGGALLARQLAEPATDSGAMRMLSAGKPIPGVQVKIKGGQGEDLPERSIGEIALRSHCMLSGYYHRPDLDEAAFRYGWYLTGDLGYLAEGELYITGRKKDLIIVGGKNIYPQDIERLAGEVDGVHPGRTVAFGMFDATAGTEEVIVLAEVDFEPEEDPQQVEAIAERIRQNVNRGSDIALRRVQVVGRGWLIKTSSGKIARQANKEKYVNE